VAGVAIAVFVLFLTPPLAVTSVHTLTNELWVDGADGAAQEWVKGTGWEVSGVRQTTDGVVMTVIVP
jgi:hypothetical protein